MVAFASQKVCCAMVAGGIVGPLFWASSAFAAGSVPSHPDFSRNGVGWVGIGTDLVAVPGGPAPVTDDPKYPHLSNADARASDGQPSYRVADITNPNLTEFSIDRLKKSNDMVHAGFAMVSREARCWATGVPAYLLNPAQPTFILQTPKKITMIWQMDQQIRHIYLDVPHSENLKPSWYGESVGHYEGDTLVVDTIGQNTKTFIDNFRTPHSEKLHVIERYRLIEDGQKLQADITIEDPVVFKQPLHVMHQWRRVQGPMTESRCVDGERYNPLPKELVEPLPTADRPDF